MFEENADALDYLLTPGDYRPLGPLVLENHPGNTAARPKTIRYRNRVDDAVHPVKRPATGTSAALVDGFRFEGSTTRHWLVRGLTVSEPTQNSVIRSGANSITVDFCLIEKDSHLLRIRGSSDCTIQRCVLRDTIQPYNAEGVPVDSTGIQIDNLKVDVSAIRILDNEIYNVGDGIQTTPRETNWTQTLEVVIEGNDIYLEQSRYIPGTETTLDENAIDLKAGSDTPRSTIIRRNRMWGFRRNARPDPQAAGELLVLQNYCRNVVVEQNIMGEAPRGMKDENWPNESGFDVHLPRNISVRENQFYEIRRYSDDPTGDDEGDDEGKITRPVAAGIAFVDNYFARSLFLADVTPDSGYRGQGPVYVGNTLTEIDHIHAPATESPIPAPQLSDQLPYYEGLNTRAPAPAAYDTYQRKRWTGPELATGAIPIPHPHWGGPTHPPLDPPPQPT